MVDSAVRTVLVLSTLLGCGAPAAQNVLWTVSDDQAREFVGSTPDGHSVLVKRTPNSLSVQRIDKNGVKEPPFLLRLNEAGQNGDVFADDIDVGQVTGAIHVRAIAQKPPNFDVFYRYFKFSPTGALVFHLTSETDPNVCGRSRVTDEGGRVFLCDEVIDANPGDPDFEYRYRVSKYGPTGVLEYSVDPPVGLENTASIEAVASVHLASGRNGRVGFGGLRYRLVDDVPQPTEPFGVVIDAGGVPLWHETYNWLDVLEPPGIARVELGPDGELVLLGEEYTVGFGEIHSQYTAIRFAPDGASSWVQRLGSAIEGGSYGLVGHTLIDAAGNVHTAGRCAVSSTVLTPCYTVFNPNGTTIAASNLMPNGSVSGSLPGFTGFSIAPNGATLLTLDADSPRAYLRRIAPWGAPTWDYAVADAAGSMIAARVGVDMDGDIYYGMSFVPTGGALPTRTEIRKISGGDLFQDDFE